MCPSVPPQPPTLSTCLLFALYAGVFTTLCVASFLLGESTLWLQGRLSRYASDDLLLSVGATTFTMRQSLRR